MNTLSKECTELIANEAYKKYLNFPAGSDLFDSDWQKDQLKKIDPFICGMSKALTNPEIYESAGLVKQEWISVQDELPNINAYVIVFSTNMSFSATKERIVQYTKYGFDVKPVTHWMPLPKNPII